MAWAGAAPMIVKMRYAVGGKIGGKAASGTGLAQYVAERQGVARVAEEAVPDPAILAGYIGERPGSTGLFGAAPGSPPALEAVQAALAAAPWWQEWTVSMRSPDADAVGLGAPQDWRAMVRRALPGLARVRGVAPEDLRWAAAVHWKQGQPHVHVLVWPGAGCEAGPKLRRDEMRAVRKAIAREVFGQQRVDLSARKTAQRDLVLRGAAEAARGEPGLAPADAAELQRRLGRLRLPGGRVMLAYMPPGTKQAVRDLADWLLTREPLSAPAGEVARLARDVATQRSGEVEGAAAGVRAAADLRDRVAQVLLRSAGAGRAPEAPEVPGAEGMPEDGAPQAEESLREAEAPEGEPPPEAPQAESRGGPESPGGPRRSREERSALRVEMRRYDPAGAVALAAGITVGGVAQHAALTAAMRRVVVVRSEVEGRDGGKRTALAATGPAADEALAILGVVPGEAIGETLAWQSARLQGLRFSDEPLPPTPADALARVAGVVLDDEQRAVWTELLRAAGAHRDATGRIEADTTEVLAAVQAAQGAAQVPETDVVVAAYRQREADWREERRDLPGAETLRRCGVTASPEDLAAVVLRRDVATGAMRAEGIEGLLLGVAPDADRALAEKEIVRAATRAQVAVVRGTAAVETDPARALSATLGLRLAPEDTQRLAGLLRQCAVWWDASGQWPEAGGEDFAAAVALCQPPSPEECLFDVPGEVARAAARVQGLWADQQEGAVAALAAVAGKDAAEVRLALRGLAGGPGATGELARRLGVEETEALGSALAGVPSWLREPEKSAASRLALRLGQGDAEAVWAERLRALQVYRAADGTLVAGDTRALEEAAAGGEAGVILAAAWRQDRDALFAAQRTAREAPGNAPGTVRGGIALAEWAGREPLSAGERTQWGVLLERAARGNAGAEAAMVRMLGNRPEALPRIRGEVAAAVAERRLWHQHPVDALAARLGVPEWDDGQRHEVDRLLRRLPVGRDGRPADREAWGQAVERVRALAPEATPREVRRAVAREVAHTRAVAPRVRGGSGLLDAVLREIKRARAEAEQATEHAVEAAL